MERRAFLRSAGLMAGGLAFATPLNALAERIAAGADLTSEGFGPLVEMDDLWLSEGFSYEIISQEGWTMTGGRATPSRFDGMAVFDGPRRNTITLLRNHENRSREGTVFPTEIGVDVGTTRYDPDPNVKGGVTKLVIGPGGIEEDYPLLGGTIFNCAGGPTPWGSWITCEEIFPPRLSSSGVRHGYIFEVPSDASGPVAPTPLLSAGRFEHEAVSWLAPHLYLTEDQTPGFSCLYRYTPPSDPLTVGALADGGSLDALAVTDGPGQSTENANGDDWLVGHAYNVSWVPISDPDPDTSTAPSGVRFQAAAAGATMFRRQEGCWTDGERIYFDCTTGGIDRRGQIWEYDPALETLTLLFQSFEVPGTPLLLDRPDNLTVAPGGILFLCEDRGYQPGATNLVPSIRGLTPQGQIFEFARAKSNLTEFCGACFGPGGFGATLFVNQQGNPVDGTPGVTYAIRGPWKNNQFRP